MIRKGNELDLRIDDQMLSKTCKQKWELKIQPWRAELEGHKVKIQTRESAQQKELKKGELCSERKYLNRRTED